MYELCWYLLLFSYKDLIGDETQEFPSTAANGVLRDVTNHVSNASGSNVESPVVITVEGSEECPIPEIFSISCPLHRRH